jgi:hypothetical protein
VASQCSRPTAIHVNLAATTAVRTSSVRTFPGIEHAVGVLAMSTTPVRAAAPGRALLLVVATYDQAADPSMAAVSKAR